jgi:glucosamine 6-phosphate synthetase-like amidotransferase/phosphosugar isomerase protein
MSEEKMTAQEQRDKELMELDKRNKAIVDEILNRMSASDEKANRLTNEQVWLQLFAAYIQATNVEIGAAYHAELADAAFYQWKLRFGRQ